MPLQDDLMDPITALSETRSAEIAAILAIRALKAANMQQKAVARLVDDAVELAHKVREEGRGEQIDLYA